MREAALEGLEPVTHSPHKMLNSINKKLYALSGDKYKGPFRDKTAADDGRNKPSTDITFSGE